MDNEQSVEEDDQRALLCNFIFFILSCVKLSFYCTTNCFPLYELNMRHLSGVFLKKLLSLSHKSRPLCDGKWTLTTTIKSLPRSTRRKVEGHGSIVHYRRRQRNGIADARRCRGSTGSTCHCPNSNLVLLSLISTVATATVSPQSPPNVRLEFLG